MPRTVRARIVGNTEVGNSGPERCSVSDNWRFVGAVRKVEFKLLQLRRRLKTRLGRGLFTAGAEAHGRQVRISAVSSSQGPGSLHAR